MVEKISVSKTDDLINPFWLLDLVINMVIFGKKHEIIQTLY
jgi:hypothetical protein